MAGNASAPRAYVDGVRADFAESAEAAAARLLATGPWALGWAGVGDVYLLRGGAARINTVPRPSVARVPSTRRALY